MTRNRLTVGLLTLVLGLSVSLAAWAATRAAASSTVVPRNNGCPSGSSDAGSGYCKSNDGRHFMPWNNGCPSGSSDAGVRYCRANKIGVSFVPKANGCPSGSTDAGVGYCRIGG